MKYLLPALCVLTLLAAPALAVNDVDVWEAVDHHTADSNGVDIHYVTLGEGPTVLFVHGFPDFWYSWRHQMAHLSGDFKTVAMDTRANNRSGNPEGVENYAMDLLLADVEAVIDDLGDDNVILVGHDWGGAIAWRFAMNHPDRVNKLVICNLTHPRGYMTVRQNATPEQKANTQYIAEFQKPDAADRFTAEGLAMMVAGRSSDEVKQRYREAYGRSYFDGMLNYYRAAWSRLESGNEELPDLDLWGIASLAATPTSTSTGEKPQSKVWFFANDWWAVFPNDTGSWLWRLDGNQWSEVLQLSTKPDTQADYEFWVDGDLVHILLFDMLDGAETQMATVEYLPGSPGTYQFWTQRPQLVDVPVSSQAETATIALDATWRLWVAYDTSTRIQVRYSDPLDNYTSWSAPITLVTGVNPDDLCGIVAFVGKVGVLWSNQETERFGFRVHFDWAPSAMWEIDEVPASQSAADVGGGMADDHVNFAVASDGTLYAAVKTAWGLPGFPEMAFLVRRPSGSWDDLYGVDTDGTRGIVVLNEAVGSLIVIYSETEGGANIVYRISDAQVISFGPKQILIPGVSLDNPTSTKETFLYELVVIAATGGPNRLIRGVTFSPF